jgi:hypothetical protein
VTLICHILLTILNHATANKSFYVTLGKLLKVDR